VVAKTILLDLLYGLCFEDLLLEAEVQAVVGLQNVGIFRFLGFDSCIEVTWQFFFLPNDRFIIECQKAVDLKP